MKKVLIGLMTSVILFAGSVSAYTINGADIYGSVGISTDYVFRGISKNNENMAVIPEVGVSYNGFYLDGKAAPVNFGFWSDANYELNGSLGYRGDYNDLEYDAGIVTYWHPGESRFDFVEYQGKLAYDFGFLDIGGGINYSNDYFNQVGNSVYLSGYGGLTPFWDVTFKVKVGYLDLLDVNDEKFDWEVSATKTFADVFDVSLAYYDTDAKDDRDFADYFNLEDIYNNRLVLGAKVRF